VELMRLVSSRAVADSILRQLGAGEGVTACDSPEAVAALLRRAAGFLCPCSPRTLVDAVERATGPWLGKDPRERIGDVLDDLVLHGDLIELRADDDAGGKTVRIYLAGPTFLLRKSGAAFLQGVVPDQPTGLPDELARGLRAHGAVRMLPGSLDADWESELVQLGFVPLNPEHWFGSPTPIPAQEHCARYARRLETAPVGGDTAMLKIIDPAAEPTFYDGRRVEAGSRRGRFVGRRERRFGRPIWCYVEIADGRILHLCDLHDEDDALAGANEAWHLQMALDACAGTPQRFRVRRDADASGEREAVIDIFSPLPRWAERRLLALGRRLDQKGPRALLSFAVPADEVEEETRFLTRTLWLKPLA
jgi:hypothetical protein